MKPTEIVEAIRATNAARAPLYLWGAPGIGKTAIVQQAAELLGIELLTLRVNLLEPVDVLGLPTPHDDGERVRWLTPDFMPRAGTRGLLFLDEFAQAPQATQCASMRMVDHLPDGWHVVAASNRTTDRAGAGQVATHVLDRFTHADFDVSRADWQAWAVRADIRPEVRAFIDFRPSLLFSFDAADRQKTRAGCSPRSWHRASRILATAPEAIRYALLAGTIGEGPAAEFCGFLQVFGNCPSPDTVLSAPDTTSIPREPSSLFALCGALADRAKTLTPARLDALMRYTVRLPLEFGALLMSDCVAVAPQCVTLPTAAAWIKSHQAIFASSRQSA
jgi:hypothetical protein